MELKITHKDGINNSGQSFASTTVPKQRVSDLLTSAFEGGSNYWYCIEEYVKPAWVQFGFLDHGIKRLEYALNPGAFVIITTLDDGGHYRLDVQACCRGLALMYKDLYKKHWVDFETENDDADTGDVFLQLCLFGKVVYG